MIDYCTYMHTRIVSMGSAATVTAGFTLKTWGVSNNFFYKVYDYIKHLHSRTGRAAPMSRCAPASSLTSRARSAPPSS